MNDKNNIPNWVANFFNSYINLLNRPEIGSLSSYITIPTLWVNGSDVTCWKNHRDFESLMIMYMNWMGKHGFFYHDYRVHKFEQFCDSFVTIQVEWFLQNIKHHRTSQFYKIYHMVKINDIWKIYAIAEAADYASPKYRLENNIENNFAEK